MNTVLLIAHVIGAIILVGPATAASSMFPRYAKPEPTSDLTDHESPGEDGQTLTITVARPGVLRVLHRITRVYGVLSAIVPALGFILAARMGILGDAWVIASMTITAVAAALLLFSIYPQQKTVMENLGDEIHLARLRMSSGLFAVAWAVVVALMILRPGASA